MRVLSSEEIFKELMIDYVSFPKEGEEPKLTNVRFKDLIPEFSGGPRRCSDISDEFLYKHQLDAINALREGKNVILTSGTGSGKTEAWAIYALMERKKVLVMYPTLALSVDQIDRLISYYSALRLKDRVVQVDRPTVKELGDFKIRRAVKRALLVITNPAFLLMDLKRYVSKRACRFRSELPYLEGFLEDVDLIVIDELDFYGSKRANLILVMIEVLVKYILRKAPQIVVLTATLANPEDLAKYLTSITGRETCLIKGEAFRVSNRSYIVLGKNLEDLRRYVIENYLEFVDDDYVKAIIKNPKRFPYYVHEVIEYLKSKGIYGLPHPYLDIGELLSRYVNDEGITLVFTPSIRTAEKIARRIKDKLSPELRDLVRTHHHLIPKGVRRTIEEEARNGKVKVLVTVRTLLQGIDLGNVIRVVHYGIPLDVREFHQREGRKGRRKTIPFTESIFIPVFESDRRLLSLGEEGLKEFANIPLEHVIINPNNKYVKMFKALFKVLYGASLSDDEIKLLKDLNLVTEYKTLTGVSIRLSDEGVRVWNNLNFYEFGPPYGYTKLIRDEEGERPIDEISTRDVIYCFQPGCFDLSSDAIVTEVFRRRVYIERLSTALEKYGFLDEANRFYETVKYRWGERPDIKSDLIKGNLMSRVNVLVEPPKNGFGKIIEGPMNVTWVLESSRPRFKKLLDTIVVIHDRESITLNARTRGYYEDFTYGYVYETSFGEDPNILRAGLAFIKLVLRLSPRYRLSLRELNYAVACAMPKQPLIYLWEGECCGITELIDWSDVRKEVMRFEPTPLSSILLWFIDEDVARYISELGIGWGQLRSYALRVLDYIEGITYLRIKDLGIIKVPKPSRNLKIVSAFIFDVKLGNDKVIYLIAKYDGEDAKSHVFEVTAGSIPYELVRSVNDLVSECVEHEYTLVTLGNELIKYCENSKVCSILINTLENERRLYDVMRLGKEVLGVDLITFSDIASLINYELTVEPMEVVKLASNSRTLSSKYLYERLISLLRTYGEERSRLIYIFYLALRNLSKTT